MVYFFTPIRKEKEGRVEKNEEEERRRRGN